MSAQISDLLQLGWVAKLATPLDFRALQFAAGLSDPVAAGLCGVSDRSWRRWRSQGCPEVAAVRLLAVMAGYIPWPGWAGWEMHRGCLFPPGLTRHGLYPGDIVHLPYWQALARRQEPAGADGQNATSSWPGPGPQGRDRAWACPIWNKVNAKNENPVKMRLPAPMPDPAPEPSLEAKRGT